MAVRKPPEGPVTPLVIEPGDFIVIPGRARFRDRMLVKGDHPVLTDLRVDRVFGFARPWLPWRPITHLLVLSHGKTNRLWTTKVAYAEVVYIADARGEAQIMIDSLRESELKRNRERTLAEHEHRLRIEALEPA